MDDKGEATRRPKHTTANIDTLCYQEKNKGRTIEPIKLYLSE